MIIWQTDHTPALSPLSCLLKENMWSSVLFQGKWKHTRWGTQSSRGVRHVVTQSVFPLLMCRIPSLHVATWGLGKWLDPLPTIPVIVGRGSRKSPTQENQSVFRSCHRETPLNTRPLARTGFSSRERDGDLSALPVSALCPMLTKFSCWGGGAWPCPPLTQ